MAELAAVAAQLRVLTEQQAGLVARRAAVLAGLRARRAAAPGGAWGSYAVGAGHPHGAGGRGAGHPHPAGAPGGGGAYRPGRTPSAGPRTDVAPRSAQTVLLTLGGLLLVLAGLVFTLVNWGRFGIGGRGAVLGGLTLAVLAAPIPLRRRRLDATAETASAVGAALVLLDAYAARAAGLAGLDGVRGYGYWAAVTALTAAAVAAYGRVSRSVLMPYVAVLLLQFPAPLAAGALHVHATGLAYALLVTACLDLAPAVRSRVRCAAGAATAWTAAAALLAGTAAYSCDAYAPALRACAPLVLAACLALTAARLPALTLTHRWISAAFAGLTLTSAAAVPLLLALPPHWSPLAAAAPAALLTGAALARPPAPAPGGAAATWWPDEQSGGRPAPGGAAAGAGHDAAPAAPAGEPARGRQSAWSGLPAAGVVVLALTGVGVLPSFLRAVAEPLRGERDFPAAWHVGGVVPVVATLLAAVAAGAAVRFTAEVRRALWCGATLCATAAALMVPVTARWPYWAAVTVAAALASTAAAVLMTSAAAAPAQEDAPPSAAPGAAARGLRAAALCGLLSAGAVALVWAQPRDGAALVVWAVAALLAGGLAVRGRYVGVAQAFAVGALGVEALRGGSAAGWPADVTGLVVLGVAVGTVPVAAVLGVAVEYSGYVVGAVGIAMTAGHPERLSLALALAGAAAAGVALRRDRRRAGAAGSAVLLAAALWVRLAQAGVHAPEAYTAGVSAVLLALGYARRRRDPAVTSWAAYGTGLGSTLLPSLLAAWADTHWQRPLLLGLAALAVTLLGARYRLGAPLSTGGAVLLADAARELAPTVVQSLGRLPHWVPVAVAGALLVYVGATYERRLVAARRLRRNLRSLA